MSVRVCDLHTNAYITHFLICEADEDKASLCSVSYVFRLYLHASATLLGTLVQHLVTQIANQPITWQQLNAFRHLDVVKTTC